METISVIATTFTSVLAALGGGAGLLFWRENRQLKQAEVKDKMTNNELMQADWEHERVKELQAEVRTKNDKISNLYRGIGNLKDELRDEQIKCQKLFNYIDQQEWFRCDDNNCTKRCPPREFKKAKSKLEQNMKEIMEMTHRSDALKPQPTEETN